MLQLTIRQALEDAPDATDHFLYLYRNKETVFYIGRSIHPLDRLHEHLGLGRGVGSQLGDIIKDNLPDSFDWIIELYTMNECAPLVQQYYPASYDSFIEGEASRMPYELRIDVAEHSMIKHYGPCLNVMGNFNQSSLPMQYNKRPIANKGVKLSATRKSK